MTTSSSAPLTYPFPRESRTDPPAELARLRTEAPFVQVRLPTGDVAWLLTRYKDIRAALADPRFSPRYPGQAAKARKSGSGGFMFNQEPANHARLRAVVNWAFTARRMAALRPRVERIADELLAQMADHTPPVDLVESFALPFPVRVIFDFLGVPLTEWETYQQLLRAYTGSVLPTSQGDTGNPGQRLHEYVKGLIEAKRRAPGDDLLTRMIEIHDENESRLSESELVAQTTGLLAAGYITTVNALARGTVALLHSKQYTALDTNQAGLERAVEEILRYGQSGDTGVLRVATEEVRLGDFVVPRGEAVLTPLAAANRDPDMFPEPDRFDINRRDNQHLSFGHGPHHCIGAPLARLELQVGFSALARSFPTLQLAVPYEEALELTGPFIQIPGGGVIVGGSRSLPVTW